MKIFGLNISGYHQAYVYAEGHLSSPASREERCARFCGVVVTSSIGMDTLLFGRGRERFVTLPQIPSLRQKILAFVLVQLRIAKFVRRENQWIGYAFSWCNAREIFSW